MTAEHEGNSPPDDQEPSGLAETQRAYYARGRLLRHFRPIQLSTSIDEYISGTKKLNHALERYRTFSFHAELDGLTDERKDQLVKEGLKAEGILDREDPDKAEEVFTIISEGYKLNQTYWDGVLDRSMRFEL